MSGGEKNGRRATGVNDESRGMDDCLYDAPAGGKGLSCHHILVEGAAHGSDAGIEFFDHALDLLAKAGFVEVDTEDVLAAVELAQA